MDHETRVPNVDTDVPLSVALLDRYLAGQATTDECALVEQWAQHAKHASVLQTLRSMVPGQEGLRERRDDEIERVIARLEERRLARVARRFKTQTLRRLAWFSGTMVVTLLALAVVWHKAPRTIETTRTYATQAGQQATFTLSDGTRVTLAPRTTLRLVQFGSSSRAVTLDGQAYFEVTRSTNTPFLVRTGTVMTQVLGTSFLIQYYANDGPMHIAVAAGKVRILSTVPVAWSTSSPVVLTAGHVADISDSTVYESAVKDLISETDWLRGQLMFRHTPVREVLRTLSRWYGYQFRCTDSTLTQENVTLAVSAQSSTEALSTLERILSVHLTVVGDTVTLTPHTKRLEKGPLHKQEYNVWIPTREVGR